MRRVALAVCAAIVACQPDGPGPHQVRVEVVAANGTTPPAWLLAPDLRDRTVRAAEQAATAWGGGDLSRLTIRYRETVQCGDMATAGGCTTLADEVLVELRWLRGSCVEATSLMHEMGHVVLRAAHEDPRWCDPAFWSAMTAAIVPLISEPECAADVRLFNSLESLSYYCG